VCFFYCRCHPITITLQFTMRSDTTSPQHSLVFRYHPIVLFIEMRLQDNHSNPAINSVYPTLQQWYKGMASHVSSSARFLTPTC